MIRELKIRPEYFIDVQSGKKNFEIRKFDRNFRVGDYLALNEFHEDQYTGRCVIRKITYVLCDQEFCKEGYVVLGLSESEIKDC